MLLATYQPKIPKPRSAVAQNELVEIFGYKPIWCVSAESLEDFLCESYFCAPNCGEELIIFQTDTYDTVDKCKWYNSIRLKNNKMQREWINNNCKFKEYTVPEIGNILFQMPMDLSNYAFEVKDFSEINPVIEQFLNKARIAQSQLQQVDRLGNISQLNPYSYQIGFQEYIKINITTHILPIMYSLNVSRQILDFVRFNGVQSTCNNIYCRFIDWSDNDCSEESFTKIVDDFFSLFDKSVEVAHQRLKHHKIGRNEPCPCGSGKKYKKCCGSRY